MKRLTKGNDTIICGVCSGIANYLNIDPTLIRLGWVALTFLGGSGVVAYIICAIVMPTH